MPYIEQDIDVEDFLYACRSRDIDELIDALIEEGHLPKSVKRTKHTDTTGASAPECEYEEALDRLHGKWNMLSADEEQTIISISKRF
jgi:hypothetical protein